MANKQYGLSAQEVKTLKEEAAIRLKNREYFLKEVHNPYRRAAQMGHIVDPAIMRFHAMSESHLEYFKPTPKISVITFALTFGAIGIFTYLISYERESRFKEIRNGRVPYSERLFKLI